MQVLQIQNETTQQAEGKRGKVAATLAVLAVCVVPVVMAVCFIKSNGVNVPKADEWVFIHWYELLCQGKLSLQELLFIENSEHKCVTAYWVMSLFTRLFSYDSLILMYAELACFCSICAIVMAWSWSRSVMVRRVPAWLVPIPFFMLNFKQAESFLWASCLIIGVVMLLIVATFAMIEKSKKVDGWFFGAIISSAFATFAHSLGSLLWPFCLIQLILQTLLSPACESTGKNSRVARWIKPVVWFACASVVSAVYVLAPHGPHPKHESLSLLRTDPSATIQYFLACVANPCACEATSGVAIGAIMCALFVWVLKSAFEADRDTKRALIVPILLFALGLVSAVGVTYGRFAGVVDHALTSRYFALFAVPILGLYLSSIVLCGGNQAAASVRAGMLVAIMAIATISGDMWGVREGYLYREQRMAIANMVKFYKLQNPEDMKELSFNATNWFKSFEDNRQIVFAEPNPPDLTKMKQIPVAGAFLVESINEETCHQYPLFRPVVVDTSKNRTLKVTGFALCFEKKKPAMAVYVDIDGKLDFPASMGLARPAVARQYRRGAYIDSGFVACYDATKLDKGLHDVNLRICCDRDTYFSYGPLIRIDVK